MKNIIENVKLVVQMVLIGVILLYLASTAFMPELTIKVFGFQPYIVMTESMEPKIAVNDVVVAKRFNSADAAVGDIITFEADIDYNGTLETITHYIYSIDSTGEEKIFRTNRHFDLDEEITPDTWLIPESQVIGSYVFHIKYLGLIIEFVKSIYGMVVIAVNIVVISVIMFINKRFKNKERILINKKILEVSSVMNE